MDLSLLKMLLSSPELGVACLGVLLIIFRNIIKAKFISKLTREHSYKVVNRIIWFVGVIAIIGSLLWGGIRFYEIEQSGKNQQRVAKSVQQIDKPEFPVLVNRVLDKKIPDNTSGFDSTVAEIHLEYVELSGLKDKSVEKKINEYIKGVIGVNDVYDGTEDLYMAVSKAAIDENLLSVLSEGAYLGHGAAGAINQVVSINLNVKNGELVQFKDLFRAGYQEKINQLANSWFSTQDYASSFEGVKDDQCFYFSGNYLYLCFSEHEVAPGSQGIVTVPIKLDDIRGIISRNGPLAYVL
ncbi:RsiV family protein [Klebsiella michiganensis]|uniref:RsiV family protein n=1 Tax=Klebsiella michiganensis TaxID=1134687 RepID=UPI00224565E8|nr:RsiV family protein [Klebsiella michiganensis]MCW9642040.1 RsiV family protein [Klebsiella michiganensis]